MSEERIRELEREIHDREKRDVLDVKNKVDLVLAQLAVMREEFAKHSELEALAARVSQLEAERLKILGGFFVLQVIGGVLLAVILKAWK